jgi:hypothetical protein
MENVNVDNYLRLLIALMVFYLVVMVYLKYNTPQPFTPLSSGIPNITSKQDRPIIKQQPNVYETEDTRMQYPLLPPVNPNVRNRIIKKTIKSDPDLFNAQSYDTDNFILDTPIDQNTNQLLYSGGNATLLEIPLQFNEPYTEQLRSQEILITPYNQIKYGNC